MISEKNLSELGLSEEQKKKLREFEKKENALRNVLKKSGVKSGIESIIAKSDLNKVDIDHVDALQEYIKNEWKEFIYY